MTAGVRAGRPSAATLALLFVLVPTTFIAAQVGFAYATLDIARGGWAAQLAGYVNDIDPTTRPVLGAHSRFVWSALAVLFPVLMVTAGATSLIVLARLPRPFKAPVVAMSMALSILIGVAFWLPGAAQLSGCITQPCGTACATKSGEGLFLIIPYMGGIFCGLYQTGFVSAFLGFFSIAGPIQVAVTTLLYAAALSLLLRAGGAAAATASGQAIAGYRQTTADFRLLLAFSSAILTYTCLMELSLWGWLVEIGADWDHAAELRSFQVGSTLYWGICNTAVMVMLYLPLANVLMRQARALAERHSAGAAIPALETWEREQGVTLMGRGAWPQIVGLLAPLLTGALAFLFQSSVGGG